MGKQTAAGTFSRNRSIFVYVSQDCAWVSNRCPSSWIEPEVSELPPPFMFSLPGRGAEVAGMKLEELGALGFRIFASSISALAFHRALKQSYDYLARGEPDPAFTGTTHKQETQALHASVGIEQLLEIERATVEK